MKIGPENIKFELSITQNHFNNYNKQHSFVSSKINKLISAFKTLVEQQSSLMKHSFKNISERKKVIKDFDMGIRKLIQDALEKFNFQLHQMQSLSEKLKNSNDPNMNKMILKIDDFIIKIKVSLNEADNAINILVGLEKLIDNI